MITHVAVITVILVILALTITLIVTFTMHLNCPTCEESSDESKVVKPEGKILHFIHVADIHLDPFYDKSISNTKALCRPNGTNETIGAASFDVPYGRVGCDTPLSLFESTLKAMKSNSEGSKFVLISGDLSAHKLAEGSPKILENIALTSNKTHQTFPDIPVFPVFGNNDLPANYYIPHSSEWYMKVLSYWKPLILCPDCPEGAVKPTTEAILNQTFLVGGYYNASIADGKMVLLALNSMYWHTCANYSVPSIKETADRQMTWLREQLDTARNQRKKVFIMSHVPPGGDPFYSGDPFKCKFYWKLNESSTYVNLVAVKYHDIVAGQFYAHTHKDDFSLQSVEPSKNGSTQTATKAFILLAPAISPVYRNNPAFRVMSLDLQQLSLTDYNQYFMDLVFATANTSEFSKAEWPVWQFDYTFSKKYPSNKTLLNADRIDELNQQLIDPRSNKYWQEYIFSRQVHYRPDNYSRYGLYCNMKHVFEDDFKKCWRKYAVPGG